jgi:RHS repeat-associated protein
MTAVEFWYSGNRIQKTEGGVTTAYTFDDENRLVQVVRGYGTIIYAYDPLGRRIAKSFGDVVNWYVYDGNAIIAAYNSSGTVTARYAHGLNIDEPLAVQRGSATSFYHADGLGSIVVLTNAAGSVVQTYSYDSFGNITPSGSINQPYTYTAREYDYETGLYYYRARYYDPKAGRFVTRDPIGFEGGDVNLYGYVKNNPISFVDPYGLWRSPSDIYNDALKDAQSKFPRSDLHNGSGDAYRHCLASCMMAGEDGNAVASFLGWANEKRGDWTHNQERGEREMDDYNNAQGRQCAKSAKSTQDCQQSCMSAVTSGNLKTYQSGSTPGYWY